MEFVSILGHSLWKGKKDEEVPEFFWDLNMDQIMEVVLESKKEYDIKRYYYRFAEDEAEIRYRQDVFKDLEEKELFQGLVDFGRTMLKVHEFEVYYNECSDEWQRRHWYLDVAHTYCKAVNALRELLSRVKIRSEGFSLLRDWLDTYGESEGYKGFYEDTVRLTREFGTIRYSLEIERDKVVVNPIAIPEDYCNRLLKIFGKDEEAPFMDNPLTGTLDMPYLEKRILGILMKTYQEVFVMLEEYCDKRTQFMDKKILRFELEIQFYLAFLSLKNRLELKGFSFCYPKISKDAFQVAGLYDIALAWKSLMKDKPVIVNEANFNDKERFFVVTGPNQGGKTTFARALGQILYFTKMGMPVPCSHAELPMFTDLLTHFSVEESLQTGRGKLKEELIRLKPMMQKDAKNSFVVINELFTTAATYDAYLMGKRVMDYFMDQDCYGVYVTHIPDLAKESDRVVSMTAGLDEKDGSKRTFRIERRPAEGYGYANTLVDKYRLTYQDVKGELAK